MTEPPPGAGSDPSMLLTTARARSRAAGSSTGDKWFITGAKAAAFAICMARTDEQVSRGEGATMFLVDADNPGFRVGTADPDRRTRLPRRPRRGRVPRLLRARRRRARRGRARLPLRAGAPRPRAAHALHALARARAPRARHRARPRRASARPSARGCDELGHGAGADRRLRDRHRGEPRADPPAAPGRSTPARPGRHESSVAKVFVSEAVCRVVDRAMQICGGLGVSRRPAARPLPRRGAAVPDLRRPLRDAPLGDRPPRRAPASGPQRGCVSSEPGRRRRHAGRRPLPLPPLLVRRPLEAWLDAHGLGRGGSPRRASARATRTPRSSLEREGATRSSCAGRRGRRCRPRRTTCCARRASCARSQAPARACRASLAVCEDEAVLGVPFYVMEELRRRTS